MTIPTLFNLPEEVKRKLRIDAAKADVNMTEYLIRLIMSAPADIADAHPIVLSDNIIKKATARTDDADYTVIPDPENHLGEVIEGDGCVITITDEIIQRLKGKPLRIPKPKEIPAMVLMPDTASNPL